MEQLQTEHGIFTNNEITGQTAQQVYDEWVVNKDQPTPPTDIELLQQENLLLKAQVQANADVSDFHEELIVELAMTVYQ